MSIIDDEDSIREAYYSVRSGDHVWAAFTYDGRKIIHSDSGTEYEEFLKKCEDEERVYGYARFEISDETATYQKFIFITWVGPGVRPLKKAKVSTDKAFLKAILKEFSKEILADDKDELKYERLLNLLG